MKILVKVILILLSPLLFGGETWIHTTHPQVAFTLEDMAKFYGDSFNIKAKSIFPLKANIHDFEPTTKDFMKLKKSDLLFAGPTGHQKWLFQAKTAKLLPEKTAMLDFFSHGEDHFWLSSKQACVFEQFVIKKLVVWGLIKEIKGDLLWCNWIKSEEIKLLRLLKEKKISKIMITHNALKPLLERHVEVLCLLEDDHHQETSSKTLKKAYRWLNELGSQVLVIKEIGFPFPKSLPQEKARVLNWSPTKPKPQPLHALVQLIEEL